MTWNHFIGWLGALYAAYYLLIFSLDLVFGRRPEVPAASHNTIRFADEPGPVRIMPEELTARPVPEPGPARRQPEVIGSAGVSFTDVFRLAKRDAIIYTQPVSHG